MSEDPGAILGRLLSEALNADGGKKAVHLEGDDAESIGASIMALASLLPGGRQELAAAVARAARALAARGKPLSGSANGKAWRSLAIAASSLGPSGVYPLGRLPFLGDSLFRQLTDEAEEFRPASSKRGRTIREAGDVLAGLVVSRQLREAISRTVGTAVVPTYDAMYEFDQGDSEVGIHLDRAEYEYTFHLLVEHSGGDLPAESTLIVHCQDPASARHFALRAGEALVIGGHATLHSWAPLAHDESRILIAAGFRRESGDLATASIR